MRSIAVSAALTMIISTKVHQAKNNQGMTMRAYTERGINFADNVHLFLLKNRSFTLKSFAGILPHSMQARRLIESEQCVDPLPRIQQFIEISAAAAEAVSGHKSRTTDQSLGQQPRNMFLWRGTGHFSVFHIHSPAAD